MAERRLNVLRLCTLILLVALSNSSTAAQAQQQNLGGSGPPTPAPSTSSGWIVSGGNKSTTGVPFCSYCLNILQNSNSTGNDTGLKVGLYRCLQFGHNELWAYNTTSSSIVSTRVGAVNQSLCLDAGSQVQYDGPNASYLPLRMSQCDGSVQQRWFFDAAESRIRSGLTTRDGQPLYVVQETNRSLVLEQPTLGSPYYNVYLSRGTDSGMATVTADFTFQAAANYGPIPVMAQAPSGEPIIQNGGFERSTILPRWPPRVDCSDPQTPSCSKSVFFVGELFSLCGWGIIRPPEWINNRLPEWEPAEGNSSLLLSYGASINQTIQTVPNSEYLLSFSLAGYLAHSRATDSYEVCSNSGDQVSLRVSVSSNIEYFSVDNPSTSTGITWFTKNYSFTASVNATVVVFSSQALAGCGPVIDDVKVTITRPFEPSSSSARTLKLVAAVLSPLIVCAVIASALICRWQRRRQKSHVPYLDFQAHGRVKTYRSADILRATNNMSTLIGEGGFSRVYKAEFADGSVGAVKVEKHNPGGASRFGEEVALLQRVHHRNLVNLTGFCAEDGLFCLVFEFLPNGTLSDRLHRRAEGEGALPWPARMRICYQLACALQYLHHETSPPIVHRDVKSANILLTATDTAKLADFGLSKVAPLDSSAFHSEYTEVRGSIGYMDPKYVRSGVLSPKSDVYSYGVVLLELISGHRAIKDMDLLPYWAADYLNEPLQAHKMVDEHLAGDYNHDDLATLIDLVKMCLQYEAHLRPSMQQVVAFLVERDFSGVPPANIVPSVPTNLVLGSGRESPISLILSVTGDHPSSSLSQELDSSESYY